jgi:NTP pyrophosphatase (non-canonical NTP hydrolase)
MLDLTAEVGELAKEILKATSYGRQEFLPIETWHDELGDVFFSLICLANSTEIDLLKALNSALEKYQARLDESGKASSKKI